MKYSLRIGMAAVLGHVLALASGVRAVAAEVAGKAGTNAPAKAALREVFETVRIYNAVPAEAEERYREAVRREYAAFCAKEGKS